MCGEIDWDPSLFAYEFGDPTSRNDDDSAPHMMLGVVINPFFDWAGDRPPAASPYAETVIYEAHVKGLTQLHPDDPRGPARHVRGARPPGDHRAPPAPRRHGRRADAGAPVRPRRRRWSSKGLRNYWGYNTIGFFAPAQRLLVDGRAAASRCRSSRRWSRSLHEAGIEVILDVVYNHTAEGNHLGPTLSFRGIDNEAYYRLVDDDPQYYMDYTGTGNSLNVRHPHSLQLIMDSLRYWVTEMHVDGFRFDLASTLAREFYDVDRLVDVLRARAAGPGRVAGQADRRAVGRRPRRLPGRQLPAAVDRVERQVPRHRPRLLARRAGARSASSRRGSPARPTCTSSDGRRPVASINFVTAHDGFTLADLVSYNEKHNDANGEDNNDGESHNRSWNCGVEGPTDDPAILALRARQQRNFLATLLLSQGVPMILHGDELGRTQQGNNNAYARTPSCPGSTGTAPTRPLIEFTAAVARLRREHPTFRRARFFDGRPVRREEGDPLPDIVWLTPDGRRDDAGGLGRRRSAGPSACSSTARASAGSDARGQRIIDRNFLLYFNAHDDVVELHAAQRRLLATTGRSSSTPPASPPTAIR